jgi:RimJ/RimL family protein N-acetyltransferase
MNFVWYDYNPNTMRFIENWLDESAVKSTGLDEGFRAFYEYWANEDGFVVGANFWCKVAFEDDKPFAVIAFCQHEHKTIIMEVLIAPDKRGQGKGSTLLKEFLNNEEIIGFTIQQGEAVIYPSNIASQKVFENAGFKYHHNHKDGNGDSMNYVYKSSSLSTT